MKNIGKRVSIIFGLLLATASACVSAQQFTMKVASATLNDVQHEWQKQFKARLEARAGNRIKVQIYPASQLGPIPRLVEGTALGSIEAFVTPPGFLAGLDPRFQVFDAAGLFDNSAHARSTFGNEQVRKQIFAFGIEKGLQPVAIFVHSPNALLSRKPVRTLGDLRGQKIRTFSTPMQVELVKRLGASPLPLPLTEVMPALQNGAIDGLLAASSVYTAFKYYDAAKALTYLPSWEVVSVVVVNKNWLASLPDDLRRAVLEEARSAEEAAADWGVADVARARKEWEQKGGENILFSAEDQEKFLAHAVAATMPIIEANSTVKREYDALVAATKAQRK